MWAGPIPTLTLTLALALPLTLALALTLILTLSPTPTPTPKPKPKPKPKPNLSLQVGGRAFGLRLPPSALAGASDPPWWWHCPSSAPLPLDGSHIPHRAPQTRGRPHRPSRWPSARESTLPSNLPSTLPSNLPSSGGWPSASWESARGIGSSTRAIKIYAANPVFVSSLRSVMRLQFFSRATLYSEDSDFVFHSPAAPTRKGRELLWLANRQTQTPTKDSDRLPAPPRARRQHELPGATAAGALMGRRRRRAHHPPRSGGR